MSWGLRKLGIKSSAAANEWRIPTSSEIDFQQSGTYYQSTGRLNISFGNKSTHCKVGLTKPFGVSWQINNDNLAYGWGFHTSKVFETVNFFTDGANDVPLFWRSQAAYETIYEDAVARFTGIDDVNNYYYTFLVLSDGTWELYEKSSAPDFPSLNYGTKLANRNPGTLGVTLYWHHATASASTANRYNHLYICENLVAT